MAVVVPKQNIASDGAGVAGPVMKAVMEAALMCATSEHPRKLAKELSAGIRALLGGLVRPTQ